MAESTTLAMEDRGPTVLAVVIASLCVSTAFIILRLVARFGIVKRISGDDYAIIVAWVRMASSLADISNNSVLTVCSSSHSASPSPYVTARALALAVMNQTSNQ